MKFFSTFFIAVFLFGLCLVEKELKRRALDAQGAEEDLVKQLKRNRNLHRNLEPAFANLQMQNSSGNPFFHLQILTSSDSTSAKIGEIPSFSKHF
jgi:hypothetical protein